VITAEKLRIHQRYKGDIDGWARTGDPLEKRAMTDQDWTDIDELLQRLALVKSVPVAESFRVATAKLLAERAPDPIVAEQLKTLAV